MKVLEDGTTYPESQEEFESLVAQGYTVQNPMPAPQATQEQEQPGIIGSLGRGLAAGSLDLASAPANWLRAAGQSAKIQSLEDVGYHWDTALDRQAAKFPMPSDLKDLDPASPRWWAYQVGNMAPSLIAQATATVALGAFGVPAPLAMAAGAGIGAGAEGAGVIEESLRKGDTGGDPLAKGAGMALAAGILNYISIGKLFGGTRFGSAVAGKARLGFSGRLLKLVEAGATEAITEAAEEPVADLINYYKLQPDLFKRMAIVGLPSFLLGGAGGFISGGGATPSTQDGQDTTLTSTPEGLRTSAFGRLAGGRNAMLRGMQEARLPMLEEITRRESGIAGDRYGVSAPFVQESPEDALSRQYEALVTEPQGRTAPYLSRDKRTGKMGRKYGTPSGLRGLKTAEEREFIERSNREVFGEDGDEGQIGPTTGRSPHELIDAHILDAVEEPPQHVAIRGAVERSGAVDLTAEERDAIIDELIDKGKLDPRTLRSEDWLAIDEIVRNNTVPYDAINSYFGDRDVTSEDARLIAGLIGERHGVHSSEILTAMQQNGFIVAPSSIPPNILTPTQREQVVRVFSGPLEVQPGSAEGEALVNIVERLLYNAAVATGIDPQSFFGEHFFGFHFQEAIKQEERRGLFTSGKRPTATTTGMAVERRKGAQGLPVQEGPSAKDTVGKYVYPVSGEWLDFFIMGAKGATFDTALHEVAHAVQFLAAKNPSTILAAAINDVTNSKLDKDWEAYSSNKDAKARIERFAKVFEALILSGGLKNSMYISASMRASLSILEKHLSAYYNASKIVGIVSPSAERFFSLLLGSEPMITFLMEDHKQGLLAKSQKQFDTAFKDAKWINWNRLPKDAKSTGWHAREDILVAWDIVLANAESAGQVLERQAERIREVLGSSDRNKVARVRGLVRDFTGVMNQLTNNYYKLQAMFKLPTLSAAPFIDKNKRMGELGDVIDAYIAMYNSVVREIKANGIQIGTTSKNKDIDIRLTAEPQNEPGENRRYSTKRFRELMKHLAPSDLLGPAKKAFVKAALYPGYIDENWSNSVSLEDKTSTELYNILKARRRGGVHTSLFPKEIQDFEKSLLYAYRRKEPGASSLTEEEWSTLKENKERYTKGLKAFYEKVERVYDTVVALEKAIPRNREELYKEIGDENTEIFRVLDSVEDYIKKEGKDRSPNRLRELHSIMEEWIELGQKEGATKLESHVIANLIKTHKLLGEYIQERQYTEPRPPGFEGGESEWLTYGPQNTAYTDSLTLGSKKGEQALSNTKLVSLNAEPQNEPDAGMENAANLGSIPITIEGDEDLEVMVDFHEKAGDLKAKIEQAYKDLDFEIETSAGMQAFIKKFEVKGTWHEWDTNGVDLARQLDKPVDKIVNWLAKGGRPNTVIMSALHHISNLLNGYADPLTSADRDIIRQNQRIPGRAKFVQQLSEKLNSEAGRMLNEAKRQVQLEKALNDFEAIISLGKIKSISLASPAYKEFRERLLKAQNPLVELGSFLDKNLPANIAKNVLMSIFYNSLLSNPGTHFVNTTANTLWNLSLVPHRALIGTIDAIWSGITGRPRSVFAGEGLVMLGGLAGGLKAARANHVIKNAWRRTGVVESLTKTEQEMGLIDPATGQLREDPLYAFLSGKGSAGKLLGGMLTAPSRALIVMDAWAKAVAEHQQELAIRYRFSKFTGEELVSAKVQFIRNSLDSLRLTDTALEEYGLKNARNVAKLLQDEVAIRERLDRMFEGAVKNEMARFAEHATFQDAPGTITKGLLHLRSRTGPIGRVFVPFMQTIMNLTKRGLELTPGVGILMGTHNKNSIQDILARQIEGAILTGILYTLMDMGKITGPPPEDPGEREIFYSSGKQPWSIRIGDKYWSYRKMEPFALPMSILAENFYKWKTAPDDISATDAFVNSFMVVRDHIVDNTFMRTLKAGMGEEWSIKNQLWWTTASFVPYSGLWRGLNRQYEDWSEGQVAIKDTTFMSVFGDSLPGNAFLQYAATEAKLSAMGGPVARKNAGLRILPREWLPIRVTNYQPDTVEQLFMDVGYYPRYPGQDIKLRTGGKYVTIPDELYRDYIIATGQRGKAALERLAARPYFNSLPTDRKRKLVEKEWDKVRDRERERVKRILRGQTTSLS